MSVIIVSFNLNKKFLKLNLIKSLTNLKGSFIRFLKYLLKLAKE